MTSHDIRPLAVLPKDKDLLRFTSRLKYAPAAENVKAWEKRSVGYPKHLTSSCRPMQISLSFISWPLA
jgi:hypothetical protein